jgi:hypothetical protein
MQPPATSLLPLTSLTALTELKVGWIRVPDSGSEDDGVDDDYEDGLELAFTTTEVSHASMQAWIPLHLINAHSVPHDAKEFASLTSRLADRAQADQPTTSRAAGCNSILDGPTQVAGQARPHKCSR